MRYKQRIIKHNIDVTKNIPSDKIKLTEIEYDPSVISHHPKSFEYYFTHGILINDERYIIKEFYVKNEDVYAVVTKDEVKYFELRMNYCSKAVLDKIIADLDKVKNAVDNNAPVLNGRTLTINGSSVELPNDLQELSLNGNKLTLSKGNSVDFPEYKNTAYDDTEVKNRLSALESKKDNDTIYDDTNLRNRVASLESKRDNDNQTLTLDGRTISISGGNSITLPEDRDTTYNDSDLKRRITELEGRTDNFVSGIGVSREGNKVKLKYTFIDGTHKEVEFEDKDTKSIAYDDSALKARVSALEGRQDRDTVYDDTALKARVKALEDKPTPTIPKEPVHRFYNGDIPGAGNPDDIKTVSKNNFRNPDGIKAGDTLEDFATDSNIVSRGIWKVLEVDGDNVKVQGIGNYFTNLHKNLNYNPDTKQLSIDGGNTITLPSDKQTISKQGNKLILSNGGGEVDLPQPNNAVAYDDKPLRDRVTALEGRRDNDNQTLSLSDRTLSISNGNSVTLPSDKQTITKQGNKLVLSNGGGEIDLPTPKDSVPYDDTSLRNRVKALEDKPAPAKQKLSLSGNTLSLTDGGSVTLPDNSQPVHRFYDGDISGRADKGVEKTVPKSGFRNPDGIKVGDTVEDQWSYNNTINRGIWKVTEVSGNNLKVQGIGNYDTNIRGNISFNANTRVLSIDRGGSVTLPNDKQTISKQGNKIVLSNGGGEVDIPTATSYNDADIKRRLGVLESKPDNDKQTLSISGNTLSISNGNSVNIPQPNLSGYVPIDEYNKLKGALEKLLTDLKGSGAWRQTGATVFEGSLDPNRHLATGNINLFGGTTDGNAFIRTNNGSTENDLAGGIG